MKYFTIQELCKTDTKIFNIPGQEERENLVALIEKILDPIREDIGRPIIVTSGYRNKAVNTKVGGSRTSQHTKGQAADITLLPNTDNGKLFAVVKELSKQGKLIYDQLIWEHGNDSFPSWVHISFKKEGGNRMQILRAKKNYGGKTVYVKIN